MPNVVLYTLMSLDGAVDDRGRACEGRPGVGREAPPLGAVPQRDTDDRGGRVRCMALDTAARRGEEAGA